MGDFKTLMGIILLILLGLSIAFAFFVLYWGTLAYIVARVFCWVTGCG